MAPDNKPCIQRRASNLGLSRSMDSRVGEVRKVHVVYFLNRGGQVEHPHLIKVQQTALNGLRLRDVKRWLSKVRGDDMPDSYSWSYKRKYKSSYVWQDLRDDDLITPISDSEYVLQGSEILPSRDTQRCSCDCQTPERNRPQSGELRSGDEQSRYSNLMLELDFPLHQRIYETLESPYTELPPHKALQNHDESEESGLSGHYSTKNTSSGAPSQSPNHTNEEVRVYKAIKSASTGPKLDAAAQTGESQRLLSNGQGISSLSEGARKVNDESGVKISSPNADENLSKSLVAVAKKDSILATCENLKLPPTDSRQRKTKSTIASHVLKQIFRCGGLETHDSRIHSLKALPSVFNGRKSSGNTDHSRSATSPKKAESQPDLTTSHSVPHLHTLQEKSQIEKPDSKISNKGFHKLVDSKREVNYALNSTRSSQSQASISGEIAAKNVTSIQTSELNFSLRNNGRLQNSPDSTVKVSQSPAALEDNVNNDKSALLSPKMISNCSPQIEPTEVLSDDVETNCMEDNRADHQNIRSKRRVRSILAK